MRERLAREGRAAYDAEFAEAPFLKNYLAVVRELMQEKGRGVLSRDDSWAASPELAGRVVLR